MSTYLCSMPFLIYNLGVEMIYILVQRLKAQNITPDKSLKVIYDVVGSLFDKNFLNEMKRKQELHKHAAVRTLFEKLAHSSIMRLNSSSMSKLFDLMLMAFKYQLLKMKYPEELLQITLNHLNSLVEIMTQFNTPSNNELFLAVKQEINYVNNIYSKLSCFDYIILKQILFRFFQGRNVKVSLFIQENLQSNTGIIYLPMNETAPPGTIKPGNYYIFKADGSIHKETCLNLTLSHSFIENKLNQRIGVVTTELGSNLYVKDKKKSSDVSGEFQPINKNQSEMTHSSIDLTNSNKSSIQKQTDQTTSYLNDDKKKSNVEAVKKEFNALADLINLGDPNSKNTFKIDLFPEGNKNRTGGDKEDFIVIERAENENIRKIKDDFDDFLEESKINNNQEEDDLLDLMDQASSLK